MKSCLAACSVWLPQHGGTYDVKRNKYSELHLNCFLLLICYNGCAIGSDLTESIMRAQKKYKLIALVVAFVLVAILLCSFFLDTSLEWGFLKIFSCIVCSIWIFFLPPAILYFVYKMKNSDLEYSAKLGFYIGTGCFIGFLLTPYYGMKSYITDLNTVQYHGEMIW